MKHRKWALLLFLLMLLGVGCFVVVSVPRPQSHTGPPPSLLDRAKSLVGL